MQHRSEGEKERERDLGDVLFRCRAREPPGAHGDAGCAGGKARSCTECGFARVTADLSADTQIALHAEAACEPYSLKPELLRIATTFPPRGERSPFIPTLQTKRVG